MESLVYPKDFFAKWTVLMIKSKHYHPRTQKRFALTADLFEKQGARVVEYDTAGASVWEEAVEVLQFGTYASFYMAMLHGVEPQYIPFVNEFKKKMK